jgi:hypothetical protein
MSNENIHIFKKGKITIPATSTSATVDHNLGYIPAHLIFTKVGDMYYAVPYLSPSVVSPLSVYASVNNSSITVTKNNSAFSQEVYYLIFRDKVI